MENSNNVVFDIKLSKIAELEKELELVKKELSVYKSIPKESPEVTIIRTELNRMYERFVLNNEPLVDSKDIRKLEILVKCIVSLQNLANSKKDNDDNKDILTEDALKLVMNEFQ